MNNRLAVGQCIPVMKQSSVRRDQSRERVGHSETSWILEAFMVNDWKCPRPSLA